MKMSRLTRFCCILVIVAGLIVVSKAFSADEAATVEKGKNLKEMPVLTAA